MPPKASTLRDIAAKSGFAISTVSMVLNDRRDVTIPEETRSTVKAFARELGYRSRVRPKLVQTIAIVTFEDLRSCFENPYFSEIYSGVEEAASGQGFDISFRRFRLEDDFSGHLKNLAPGRVDGVLVLGEAPAALLEGLDRVGARVACVNSSGGPQWDSVSCDPLESFKLVFEKFLEAGHRRFFCLKTPSRLNPGDRTYGHIQQAMALLGIPEESLSMAWTDGDSAEAGYAATKSYLAKHARVRFTAAFSGLAKPFGMVKALREEGYAIPRDISVILAGAARTMPSSSPELSAVTFPLREMGRESVLRLIQRARGETSAPCRILLPVEYADRGSVRRLGPQKSGSSRNPAPAGGQKVSATRSVR